MPRFDVNKKEITADCRVILLNHDDNQSGDVNLCFERKIYGIVHSDVKHNNYCVGNNWVLVNFTKPNTVLTNMSNYATVETRKVRILEESEYEEYDNYLKEAEAWATNYLKELETLSSLPVPTVNYTERTFNFDDKSALSTNLNVVVLGNWTKQRTFNPISRRYRKDCCAFTQTRSDLEVYIPDVWLKYYGYTVSDLVEWLKFLSGCEIGFEAEYRGLGSLPEAFVSKIRDNFGEKPEKPFQLHTSFARNSSSIFPTGLDGFHCVRMRGSEYYVHTYMRFICLRYMYNNFYWTIPGHALQIKNALGDANITNWQALLMAHLYEPYYNYYALVGQTDLTLKNNAKHSIPGVAGKRDALNCYGDFDRHVDPFQDVKSVLEGLQNVDRSMNAGFDYTCDAFKREDLRKFFHDRDYVGLFNYVKEKRVEKGAWQLSKYKR